MEPVLWGGIGELKSNSGTQWYQQDRIYSAIGDTIAMAHPAQIPGGSYLYLVREKPNYIFSCAIRTRAYNGIPEKLEIGNEIANSITTVYKDSMVLEIYE